MRRRGLLHLADRSHRMPDIGSGAQIGSVRGDQRVDVMFYFHLGDDYRNTCRGRKAGFLPEPPLLYFLISNPYSGLC